MIRTRLSATLLAGVAAIALAACGGVDSEDVQSDVENTVEQAVGSKPDEVDCPDLEGEEDESITCTATADGTEYEVTVTVVEVNDDEVRYNIEGPTPVDGEEEAPAEE